MHRCMRGPVFFAAGAAGAAAGPAVLAETLDRSRPVGVWTGAGPRAGDCRGRGGMREMDCRVPFSEGNGRKCDAGWHGRTEAGAGLRNSHGKGGDSHCVSRGKCDKINYSNILL